MVLIGQLPNMPSLLVIVIQSPMYRGRLPAQVLFDSAEYFGIFRVPVSVVVAIGNRGQGACPKNVGQRKNQDHDEGRD